MPRARSILIAGCFFGLACCAGDDVRLLFTGDILLSRQVRREIEVTGRFPWDGFAQLFHGAAWVAGNLEGAVGDPRECLPAASGSPCFDIPPASIPLLTRAGFRALGIANNHAFDLGSAGHRATREALQHEGLEALSWEDSPAFVKIGAYDAAVIAVSLVPGRDGARQQIPSTELRQKLRLARNLADIVVVFIHWGSELLDWPDTEQRNAAGWLVRNGADLIIGHHPHVVQAPECVQGRPVFFSLGNHLFDQKYPATKQGLIADCHIRAGVLECAGIGTQTPTGSAFPQPGVASFVPSCPVRLAPPANVNGYAVRARVLDGEYVMEGRRPLEARAWRSPALPLVSAEAGKLAGPAGPDYLLTLERHPSSLDGEDGLRPYVYEARETGLVARWRGSALAWPLLDAALLPGNSAVLCALHRRDSFLVLQPGASGVRTAAYRWNGFGFSGVDDPQTLEKCRVLFEVER